MAGQQHRRTKAFVLAVALLALAEPSAQAEDVHLSSEEFKRLDTFEGHVLAKADKVFVAKDYKRAAAEYDSFILGFPRSKAIAYALLRKARCLQLADKRYEAIREYTEVLDYFPNAVKYAAAALYYVGECHWANADEEKAMAAWAKMAEDVDYRKHVLAAPAINSLADHLAKEGQVQKAAAYYQQVAIDFRRTNGHAAREALGKAVAYFIRTKPDEPKLRAFYQKVGSFNHGRRKTDGDLATSRRYWGAVRGRVRQHAQFTETQGELRDRYYRYWAKALDGKFPDWDDYQIDLAGLKLAYEKDLGKWMQRLDRQFARGQKAGDYARIVRWMGLFAHHKTKVTEYYNKLRFEKMTNQQIREVMATLYDRAKNPAMARNVFGKLRLGDMPDGEKAGLAHYLYRKDGALVKDVCMTMEDKELGHAELLRFYHWLRDAKRGVPQADRVAGMPRFAQEALYKKAELLHWSKQYQQAVAAYQQADQPPATLWGIADCYAKMGRLAQAVGQLREIEAFFKKHAPEAALRIAHLYARAKKTKLQIAALRSVLKKYPKSHQSSSAHQDLERLGIKIGGGIDAN